MPTADRVARFKASGRVRQVWRFWPADPAEGGL